MAMLVSIIQAIFWGLVVLSILVFVHEGGHYLAARAWGMRVTEFFLGLPCSIKLSHKSKTHGTEVGITPVLLGGYTRICGMGDPGTDEPLADMLACVQSKGSLTVLEAADALSIDDARAYNLLACLADWGSIGLIEPTRQQRKANPEALEHFVTLRRDAEMRTEYDAGNDFAAPGATEEGVPRPIPGDAKEFLARERSHTYLGGGFWARVSVLFAGPFVNLLLAFAVICGGYLIQGIEYATNSNTIASVEAGSYAEKAGLHPGDTITAIDSTKVSTWKELCSALNAPLSEGRDFSVMYERDGHSHTAQVDLPDGQKAKSFGIIAQTATYHPSLGESAGWTLDYAFEVARFAVRLIIPQHTVETLSQTSSVVGISAMAGQAASAGPSTLALFAAMISMSLGVMNLLPIPPLDGGKILIELIQLILRRQLSLKAQSYVSYAGLAFFLVIFFFAVRNDIVALIAR